jgi:hypothetical protein
VTIKLLGAVESVSADAYETGRGTLVRAAAYDPGDGTLLFRRLHLGPIVCGPRACLHDTWGPRKFVSELLALGPPPPGGDGSAMEFACAGNAGPGELYPRLNDNLRDEPYVVLRRAAPYNRRIDVQVEEASAVARMARM